jgi:hypothetical protein
MRSLLDVPKRAGYNNTFFYDVVVPDLLENLRAHSRRRTLKGVFVHLDNASPHNSQKSNECLTKFLPHRMPHPAESPDLAQNDFIFF